MADVSIPDRLPLLQISDNILFPGSSMRLPISGIHNLNLVRSQLIGKNTLRTTIIGVLPVSTSDDDAKNLEEDDDEDSLHPIGTAAVVVQVSGSNWPNLNFTLLLTGLTRFRVEQVLQDSPFTIATVSSVDHSQLIESALGDGEFKELVEKFRADAKRLVDMLDITIPVVGKLKRVLDTLPGHQLPDICASIVKASYREKLEILNSADPKQRFYKALPLLQRQIEGLRLLEKAKRTIIDHVPRKDVRSGQIRKIFKISSQEPGDEDGDGNEIQELEERIKLAGLPAHATKVVDRELKRLKKMSTHMPDHAVIRNYLDLVVDLPWNRTTTDSLDITKARQDLDADHYGLPKVKRRILEFLAVRKLNQRLKGPILCFVGAPGVGKTSVGRSVARTMGREFHRISLGGVHDQSDIRGHRRTYIGSMPGRIVHGLRSVGTKNPVFLLDEVDKMGRGIHGDPAAALLEVLDPEQNSTFTDHYLNIPFDLSQVLFIATANTTSTIPSALLDRMEVIDIHGYTLLEKTNCGTDEIDFRKWTRRQRPLAVKIGTKTGVGMLDTRLIVQIADKFLIPKQLSQNGLNLQQIRFTTEAIRTIGSRYTREAGVRGLERRLAEICRTVAVTVAEARPDPISLTEEGQSAPVKPEVVGLATQDGEVPKVIDHTVVETILGAPRYELNVVDHMNQPGVAIGLAWTPYGGEVMLVEACRMGGDGQLSLTGMLGDVMKESARLALDWVRSNVEQLNIPLETPFSQIDLHLHFPAGAVEKDGPSAGVAILTVLVSLFTDRCVRSDTCMTGEITLRGLVLPVGGVKEKVLAGHAAGLTRVILPNYNQRDLADIPQHIKDELTFVPVSRVEEVLDAAFEGGFTPLSADLCHLTSKL